MNSRIVHGGLPSSLTRLGQASSMATCVNKRGRATSPRRVERTNA